MKHSNASKQHPSCMADGGEVKQPGDGFKKGLKKFGKKPRGRQAGDPGGSTADTLRSRRKKQMEDLGI